MFPTPSVLAVLSLAGLVAVVNQPANPQSANKPRRSVQVEQHPFTVELKTTNVQTLANGVTITNESTEIHAIDSQFRSFLSNTRPLWYSDHHELMTSVHINDPVEGTQIDWNSQRQEATVVKLPPADQQHGCWQTESGHMSTRYGEPARNSVSGGSARGARASASPAGPTAHKSLEEEDLGTATIEGLEVHGRRDTRTIPIGQIGNDQPLVTTHESWTAPSLGGFPLRTVTDDPQRGRSVTEVVRLDLSEPALSTFQPPEGYKVIVEEMHQVPCKEPGRQ